MWTDRPGIETETTRPDLTETEETGMVLMSTGMQETHTRKDLQLLVTDHSHIIMQDQLLLSRCIQGHHHQPLRTTLRLPERDTPQSHSQSAPMCAQGEV